MWWAKSYAILLIQYPVEGLPAGHRGESAQVKPWGLQMAVWVSALAFRTPCSGRLLVPDLSAGEAWN